MGFIDEMRAKGHAVESIIRVLREQGMKVAARTYRAWRQGRVAVRTVTDAQGSSTRIRLTSLTKTSGLAPSLFVLKDPRPKNVGRSKM